ncbi:hypothetical protein [Blautia hominis]
MEIIMNAIIFIARNTIRIKHARDFLRVKYLAANDILFMGPPSFSYTNFYYGIILTRKSMEKIWKWYEFSIFAALCSRIGAGSIAENCGIGDAKEKKIRKLSQ